MLSFGIRSLYPHTVKAGIDAGIIISCALRGNSWHVAKQDGPQRMQQVQDGGAHDAQSDAEQAKRYVEDFLDEAPVRFVYRGDRRPPSQIFTEGLRCRRPFREGTYTKEDLEDYCMGLSISDDSLSVLSTSRRKAVAHQFAIINAIDLPRRDNRGDASPKPQSTVYKIATEGLPCLDVNQILRSRSRFAAEEEIAFLRNIPPQNIIKAKNRILREIYRNPACQFPDDPCSSSDEEYAETDPSIAGYGRRHSKP